MPIGFDKEIPKESIGGAAILSRLSNVTSLMPLTGSATLDVTASHAAQDGFSVNSPANAPAAAPESPVMKFLTPTPAG